MTDVHDVAAAGKVILDEVERLIVGKRETLELLLSGVLARGHILIEDFPGLAKTLIARSLAQVTGLQFHRVQFTPDLLPSDITGSSLYDQRTAEFTFQPGPIFTNLLLGDEINRTPPKTQAALLEAMAEQQVTVDGVTRALTPPFIVVATQNPIEYEGTYPLPEAQLDRFLLRIRVGYPSAGEEAEILRRRVERRSDSVTLNQVVDRSTLLQLQAAVEDVHVEPSIEAYIVALVASTRQRVDVLVGASPRGSLAILASARSWAALSGRDFVVPEDVKRMAVPALGHRLTLRPELWVRGMSGDDVVRGCLDSVPTPSTRAPLVAG
ncbi:MAG TPA: MoxR family ATPase [Candidatus Binatia bacterium]|nr:MoxR family ATPase [Candidatus Binatia bacterium]